MAQGHRGSSVSVYGGLNEPWASAGIFSGGSKNFTLPKFNFVYKTKLLSAKRSSVFRMFLDFQVILLSIVSIDDSKNSIKLYPFIIKD